MNGIENIANININMLSATVSYLLFDRIYGLTGDIESLGILREELGSLVVNSDINAAFLTFQYLMAVAEMEIPLEIRALSSDDCALEKFVVELFLDLDDYYTEELDILKDAD